MKIAVTTTGKTLDDQVDLRFGRAHGFIIHDTESGEWEFADNEQNLNAASGAGVQSAQNLANRDVQAVITGHVGPKAFSVLAAAGIKVLTGADGIVKEALDAFKKGELSEASAADVPSHW
ncbi:MAG TPA: dinitrogenase iron-molybdenum cofactor biosynthesis protein [Planctomycetes bacterium]|nr:dinitrogenase iron-molybdenum cofactor biosynthesis protein [Planctomycetota bacterium]